MPNDPIRPTDNAQKRTDPNEPQLFVLPAAAAIESPVYVNAPQVRLALAPKYRCHICRASGTYTVRAQEFVLRIGDRAVIAPVMAATCGMCGESVLDGPTAQYLDDISGRLRRGVLAGWEPVGALYRVPGEPFHTGT